MVYDSDMYPVQFDVEYPEIRNRLTALVRLILVIPAFVIIGLISPQAGESIAALYVAIGLYVAIALMILFRRKYPRWWFDWNLELSRFNARIFAYLLLLRDEYPSTDEAQAVSLDIAYPDAETQLNRFMPLIKWILAIPHFIILSLLSLLVFFVTIIAWFAILIVGRYPRGLFDFSVGFARWGNRVFAYAFLMTTDRYPPFRMSP